MGNDTLETLERLTRELPPPLTEMATFGSSPQVVEYEVEGGVCIGFGLYNSGDVAVQRAFLTKGGVFPEHAHPHAVEHLIVIKGSMRVFAAGEEPLVVGPGEHCEFQMGQSHHIEILENTWLIGITIPSGEGYPSGR